MTKQVQHFMIWHYAHNQYRDTEPWLWRHTVYRVLGIRVWTRREKKVYQPIWSWAATAFAGRARQYYSCFGGDPVTYNWETGEITAARLASTPDTSGSASTERLK